ncbi:5-formyltetrahydrofolate cyclo-ligase [Streptomyces hirsutus]|uniref:5-formyltetrahydrofolate cyclo-ligase n=1 Tax=Streptomyces hirsutus TaxID=35620 RepID=UPI0036553B1E
MAANSPDRAKQAVRTQVWDTLTAADAIHDPSVHGRMPHFKGTEQAAVRLAELPAWQRAGVVKAVPDKAQLPVRVRALEEGKTVYMAVPKLATLTLPPTEAAAGRTAAAIAPTVEVDALRPLDLIVLGSVAVNRDGARIGKGAGYSDIQGGSLRSPRAARPPAGPALLSPPRSSPAGTRAARTAISRLTSEKGYVVAGAVGSTALRTFSVARL